MARHIEINPANHLTIGTVGQPGNRTFFLQGGRGSEVISLVIEKIQAAAIADSFEELLADLAKEHPAISRDLQKGSVQIDLRLHEPVDPLFRVGNLGLGYNDELERVIVVAYELVAEEEDANMVSFWVKAHQAQALIEHARTVVSSGRPICGNCGNPIDADGHFCPHRNGYKI